MVAVDLIVARRRVGWGRRRLQLVGNNWCGSLGFEHRKSSEGVYGLLYIGWRVQGEILIFPELISR
jgi:hypothetical protein